MDDLCLPAVLLLDIEGDGTLHAVEIVVHAGLGIHHEGGGHSEEVQPFCQQRLEEILHFFDGDLSIIEVQL